MDLSGNSISVVIPTYNRADGVRRAIEAALGDEVVREVVVVDDGSTDATPQVLDECARADPRVRVVRLDNVGAPRARDRGAHEATGEIVAFIDDDVVLAPGTLTGHARHHRNAERLVVIGAMPVRLADAGHNSAATLLYAADYQKHCERLNGARGPALLLEFWGGHFSVRRDDALAVGLYSDAYEFRKHEDRELGIRMMKAGLDAVYDATLAASHEHTRSFRRGLEEARVQVAGRHRLHELHSDVLGPWPGPAAYADGLEGVPRLLARAAALPGVGPMEVAALSGAARVAGRLHRTRVQVGAAAVARTIVQQREARRLFS